MRATTTTFAARLTELRQAKGLCRYRLAQITGLSPAHVTFLEQGRRRQPKLDTLQRLAAALQVSMQDLTAGVTS